MPNLLPLLLASSAALFTTTFCGPSSRLPLLLISRRRLLHRRLAATFGDRQRARPSIITRQLLRLPNASKLRQQLLLKLTPTSQSPSFSSLASLPSNNMNDDNNYRRRFESVPHAHRLQDFRNPHCRHNSSEPPFALDARLTYQPRQPRAAPRSTATTYHSSVSSHSGHPG